MTVTRDGDVLIAPDGRTLTADGSVHAPPVDPTKQAFRLITVANDAFQDWFGPHDASI